MLKNYLELLKKGIESFSHLGKNGSWIDYLSTIKYEFLILLIGIGIIIGTFLICIGPYFYNKFANRKANALSGKNITDLATKRLANLTFWLSNLNYNLIINDKDFFTVDNKEFDKNIKNLTQKEKNAIIDAISKFRNKLVEFNYYDLTIASNFSCVNNLLQTYKNNKNIDDLLVDTIRKLYQLRIDCINMRVHIEKFLKNFTTIEEFSKITKQMNKINELKTNGENPSLALMDCINVFNKKYYVCKTLLLLVFYIPYIIVVVPLLMMLF